MTLLNVAEGKRDEVIKDIKSLADQFKDIPEFAEQVTKKYINQ